MQNHTKLSAQTEPTKFDPMLWLENLQTTIFWHDYSHAEPPFWPSLLNKAISKSLHLNTAKAMFQKAEFRPSPKSPKTANA